MGNNSKKLKFHSLLKNSSTVCLVLDIRYLHLKDWKCRHKSAGSQGI